MSLNSSVYQLEKIVLLIWDERENFENPNTQLKIGKDLFKDAILIENLDGLKSVLSSFEQDQEFIFLVHLFHNLDNKGFYHFKNSKILKVYPSLKYYLISSAPKKSIYEKDLNQNLDVYTYDSFHENIGKSKTFVPQSKKDLISICSEDIKKSLKGGIFLSHSSEDKVIVEKFRDLILQGGLNCHPDSIKFTSSEDHGIPGGVDIPKDLREFMKDEMGLFFQFISDDYKKSRVCINEEGAAWCLLDDLYFIPILLPAASHKDISWVKNHSKAIKGDDKGSLLNIYQNRKQFFGNEVNITRYSKKVEEFIDVWNSSPHKAST